MGQTLPLPERIPKPNTKTLTEMKVCGIIVEDADEEYVTYTLPKGWKMVDSSWREDLPDFYIIDSSDMKRFCISGSWKGTYDNKLNIRSVKQEKYESPKSTPIPSETSGPVLYNKLETAIICDEIERRTGNHIDIT